MNCDKCQRKLRVGENVVEIAVGVIDMDNTVLTSESQAVLCIKCEEKVMPALWANIDELKKGHDNFECPKHSS